MDTTATALFGRDLFGEPIQPNYSGIIARKFIVPPFSVLNAREGDWQNRKRAWERLGIDAEVQPEGRDSGLTHNTANWFAEHGKTGGDNTTSIFDPVLCELAYTWFCPAGGQVVDPFAGGSVRGIVAHVLGYKYWGCDLSAEQITANEQQADDILGTIPIKISAACMRQLFQPCTKDYITANCRGRCCQGSDNIMVAIHATEEVKYRKLGATIKDGFIVADNRGLCPFKSPDGLCNVHEDKPLGCRFSPFTLNSNDTLIVRNRYRCLKCYGGEGAIPAYNAHSWSLAQVLGGEHAKVAAHLADGGGDITVNIPARIYAVLKDNDAAKGNKIKPVYNYPTWICGDSMDELDNAPMADFIFSCPPYGDLEVYSDHPRDLSNMEYHTFIAAYKRIIMRACARLKDNRFACFVVGDFRDKRTGNYRDFVSATIGAFAEQGLALYNEAILVTSVGSLPIRITKQFESGRKLGKTHQNVLVFVKGDGKRAARAGDG